MLLRVVRALLWVAVCLSTIYGGLEFVNTLVLANSAPQQAAGAAMALGYAVIPYVLARAIDGLLSAIAGEPTRA
jgi:hypothetical protein